MVVFFDIDGTIVDEKTQQIPQSAIDAVATLTERGHIPVINTGRPYCHIDPRVRQMAFPAWVCGCGMEVLYQGNWLSRQHPGDDLCAYVIRRARECGMLTLYEAREGAIVLDGSYALHPAIQLEKTRMAAKGFRIYTVEEHPRFMKFLTQADDFLINFNQIIIRSNRRVFIPDKKRIVSKRLYFQIIIEINQSCNFFLRPAI